MIDNRPTRIDFVVDTRGQMGFVVSIDDGTQGGPHSNSSGADSEIVAQVYDSEYALWIAQLGQIKSDLCGVIESVKAAGGNPMAAIGAIKDTITRVMAFVEDSPNQVAAIDEQAKKVQPMLLKKFHDKKNRSSS